jgi:hypothetical protein
MPSDHKRLRDGSKKSKKKKSSKGKSSKSRRKKKSYEDIDDTPVVPTSGKESYGDEPWCLACDCKRCLNGRCGVGWLPIFGLTMAAGFCTLLWIGGFLDNTFETSGDATLYEEICDSCTTEPTGTPTLEPTGAPSVEPTKAPTGEPTIEPTGVPSVEPTIAPSGEPTLDPSGVPTVEPTADPTSERRLYDLNEEVATPNIVVIVTENLHMSDFSRFKTPNMKQFFEESYTLSNVHTQASKGSLMTGQWSHKLGLGKILEPCDEGHMDLGVPTWAKQLKFKGYKNHYYGKWNLGADSWDATPLGRGWDSFYGSLNHPYGLEHGDGGSWVKSNMSCSPSAKPVSNFKTGSKLECLVKCYGSKYAALKHSNCQCYSHADCSKPLKDSFVYIRLSQKDVFVDWWDGNEPANPGVGMTGDELALKQLLKDFQSVNTEEKWTITVSLASPGAGFAPVSKISNFCRQYFVPRNKEFDFQLGLKCQWMWDIDEKVGTVIDELKKTDVWKDTILIFTNFNPKDDKTIFSIGGGALPAHLVSLVNKELHSVVDMTPTIMAIAGFSDKELGIAGLDGVNVIDINQATAMVHDNIDGSTLNASAKEHAQAGPEKCGSKKSYISSYGLNYNAPWLDKEMAKVSK